MDWKSTLIVSSVLFSFGAFAANAQQTYLICDGEFESGCPSQPSHSIYLKCGESVKDWAESACKVQNSNEPAKYALVRTSNKSGNKCGYGTYTVTCIR
jgi:hypothetical protein